MADKNEKKPKKGTRPKQPTLRVPDDLQAIYSNLVRIAHTPSEIVFDFSRLLPGDKMATVVSRVLTSPLSAKLLMHALTENLKRYEASFGEIVIPQKQTLADFAYP